jgi:hypothetical protein
MWQKGLFQLSLKPAGEVGRHPRAILSEQMAATRYMLKVPLAIRTYQKCRPLGDDIPHDVLRYRYGLFGPRESTSMNIMYMHDCKTIMN